jgi:predicted site-specific integrase-resolvase
MKVSIGRAARELGVSRETLRRWEAHGTIQVERAPNGRRRYDLEKLQGLVPSNGADRRITLAYARVNSPSQGSALDSQVALLESFCSMNGWSFQVLCDVGSGVSDTNGCLRELLRRICVGEVSRLVVTHRGRVPLSSSDLVFSLCEFFKTEVVIINATEDAHPDGERREDISGFVGAFDRLNRVQNHHAGVQGTGYGVQVNNSPNPEPRTLYPE